MKTSRFALILPFLSLIGCGTEQEYVGAVSSQSPLEGNGASTTVSGTGAADDESPPSGSGGETTDSTGGDTGTGGENSAPPEVTENPDCDRAIALSELAMSEDWLLLGDTCMIPGSLVPGKSDTWPPAGVSPLEARFVAYWLDVNPDTYEQQDTFSTLTAANRADESSCALTPRDGWYWNDLQTLDYVTLCNENCALAAVSLDSLLQAQCEGDVEASTIWNLIMAGTRN